MICPFAKAKEAGLKPAPQFGETLNFACISSEMVDSREGGRGGNGSKERSMPPLSSNRPIQSSHFKNGCGKFLKQYLFGVLTSAPV
jgi:hypothetical protein